MESPPRRHRSSSQGLKAKARNATKSLYQILTKKNNNAKIYAKVTVPIRAAPVNPPKSDLLLPDLLTSFTKMQSL